MLILAFLTAFLICFSSSLATENTQKQELSVDKLLEALKLNIHGLVALSPSPALLHKSLKETGVAQVNNFFQALPYIPTYFLGLF
jgi:hypothetical protein